MWAENQNFVPMNRDPLILYKKVKNWRNLLWIPKIALFNNVAEKINDDRPWKFLDPNKFHLFSCWKEFVFKFFIGTTPRTIVKRTFCASLNSQKNIFLFFHLAHGKYSPFSKFELESSHVWSIKNKKFFFVIDPQVESLFRLQFCCIVGTAVQRFTSSF